MLVLFITALLCSAALAQEPPCETGWSAQRCYIYLSPGSPLWHPDYFSRAEQLKHRIVVVWTLMAGNTPGVLTNYHATGTYLNKAACERGVKEWHRRGVKYSECVRMELDGPSKQEVCGWDRNGNWLPSGRKKEKECE
jgi:hypothetical protein